MTVLRQNEFSQLKSYLKENKWKCDLYFIDFDDCTNIKTDYGKVLTYKVAMPALYAPLETSYKKAEESYLKMAYFHVIGFSFICLTAL